MASLLSALAVASPSAQADPACTMTADPGQPAGLQTFLDAVGSSGNPNPVACIPSGSYTTRLALILPIPMTVIGTGPTRPTIACTGNICFDGSLGPNDVTLQNLSLSGASKSDIQIGVGATSPTVSGWTMSQLTVTGAGRVGIAMNNAANITVSNTLIDRNGYLPYNAVTNPNGGFGLRANRVNTLTVQDSVISNNPTTSGLDTSYAGGAKFSTDTNLVVQRNDFRGNAGGGQLWIDISTTDFHIHDNTIEEVPNAASGKLPNEAIRVEVSCAGPDGSEVEDNTVTAGTVAGIDVFDSSGITVAHNTVTLPPATNMPFGIRMFGNIHGIQPDDSCQQGGQFPNRDNVAIGNTIDVSNAPKALNGVKDSAGITENNVWSDNVYIMRRCNGPSSTYQWTWWDGTTNQKVGYAGWQGYGQDVGGLSTCTSTYPEIALTSPFTPPWGPVGTVVHIHGSGFANLTSVTFSGHAASFTRTATDITATVPTGATTGPVCVADHVSSMCSSTNFQVTPVTDLAVTTTGNGTGIVTTLAPYPGIDCGATCGSTFPQGSSAVLHAAAAGNSSFAGWSGAGCSGTADCTVHLSSAQAVTASSTAPRCRSA